MGLQARNAGKRDSDGDRFVASLLVTVAAIRGLLGARTRGTSQTPYPKHAWQKSCCSMLLLHMATCLRGTSLPKALGQIGKQR